MAFRYPAAGTYTFDTQTGSDADQFLYTDPVATDATLPQAANTARRWCWDSDDTTSTDVGPTSGAGGDPDGYLYTEASSPAAFDDEFYLEFDTTLNAATNDIEVQFKTNQRGDNNDATCVVETNENGAGWVERGSTFGGSGDPNKVDTGGTQIWASRSVDLTGLISHSSTRIRIKITFPSSGTSWHNDYGLDEIVFIGTDKGPTISSVDTDDDVDDEQTSVIVAGTLFGATDTGSADVEIGDNAVYASANKISQSRSSWSATSITISAIDLGTQSPGTKWMWVTDSTGTRGPAHQITVHRAQGWVMSASADIPASGANTTARLTPPSGKTTGDFDAGRIQDDENPADAVNITTDNYTEMAWSIEAKDAARNVSYRFRVTVAGEEIDTYTVNPQTTVEEVLGLLWLGDNF